MWTPETWFSIFWRNWILRDWTPLI